MVIDDVGGQGLTLLPVRRDGLHRNFTYARQLSTSTAQTAAGAVNFRRKKGADDMAECNCHLKTSGIFEETSTNKTPTNYKALYFSDFNFFCFELFITDLPA